MSDYYTSENQAEEDYYDETEQPRSDDYQAPVQRSRSSYKREQYFQRRQEKSTPARKVFGLILLGGIISFIIIGLFYDVRYLLLIGVIFGIVAMGAIIFSIIARLFTPGAYVSFWDIIFLDDFIEFFIFLIRIAIWLVIAILKDSK